MYKSKKPYFYGTGRRKSSVARVHLFQNGTGAITINGRDIDEYFGLETLKLLVRQPLVATEQLGKVDIVATVTGGGVTGQAGGAVPDHDQSQQHPVERQLPPQGGTPVTHCRRPPGGRRRAGTPSPGIGRPAPGPGGRIPRSRWRSGPRP